MTLFMLSPVWGFLAASYVRGQQELKWVILREGQVNWGETQKCEVISVYSGTWRTCPALGHQNRWPNHSAPGGLHPPEWVRASLFVHIFMFLSSLASSFDLLLQLLHMTLTPYLFVPIISSLTPAPSAVTLMSRMLMEIVLCTVLLSTTNLTASSCCWKGEPQLAQVGLALTSMGTHCISFICMEQWGPA